MVISLPCFPTFWCSAIPTSCYIFNVFSYLFMSIFLVQDTCYKIGIIMIGSFLHACNLQARLCIKLYNSHVIVVDCKPFRSNNTLALYRKLLLLCVYIAAIILTWFPNLLFCPFHIFFKQYQMNYCRATQLPCNLNVVLHASL